MAPLWTTTPPSATRWCLIFQRRGLKVSTVDQYRNFLKPDGAIDPALFSNQINNPNATGYDRMAQTWFDAIQAILATAKIIPIKNTFVGEDDTPHLKLDTATAPLPAYSQQVLPLHAARRCPSKIQGRDGLAITVLDCRNHKLSPSMR